MTAVAIETERRKNCLLFTRTKRTVTLSLVSSVYRQQRKDSVLITNCTSVLHLVSSKFYSCKSYISNNIALINQQMFWTVYIYSC